MHSTSLNFLCLDGAVKITFAPALDADQYAELMELVGADNTIAELSAVLIQAGARWGVQVVAESC